MDVTRNSGSVFLTNDEYQVAMEDNGKLYSFYSTPYSGYEGSYEDLRYDYEQNPDGWDEEDVEFLNDIAQYN